jgi:hypothetical protein
LSHHLVMRGQDQITRVNDIAISDQKFEKKATLLVKSVDVLYITVLTVYQSGEDLIINAQETIGKPFQRIDRSVRAILVRIHSDAGLVRVYSRNIRYVAIGPDQGIGFTIAVIQRDEYCIVHGHPSMRLFL